MKYVPLILAVLLIATTAYAGDACRPAACAAAVGATIEVPVVAIVKPAPVAKVASAAVRVAVPGVRVRVDAALRRPERINRTRHAERVVVRDKR